MCWTSACSWDDTKERGTNMRDAMLYERRPDQEVQCHLCPHRCRITASGFGTCGMRQNLEGQLYTHAYGEVIAANADPIEKNRCIIFCRDPNPFPLPRRDAILNAGSARTGRFPRPIKKPMIRKQSSGASPNFWPASTPVCPGISAAFSRGINTPTMPPPRWKP